VSVLNRAEGRRHRFAAEVLARSARDVVIPWPVFDEVVSASTPVTCSASQMYSARLT
jgi:hypothetical protein